MRPGVKITDVVLIGEAPDSDRVRLFFALTTFAPRSKDTRETTKEVKKCSNHMCAPGGAYVQPQLPFP